VVTSVSKPVLYAHRSVPTGVATLRTRSADLIRRGTSPEITVRAIYRYDATRDVWRREPSSQLPSVRVPIPAPKQIYTAETDPVLVTFPPLGLFWAVWEEDGQRYTSAAYAGPIMCNDVMLGTAPSGRVSLCVPFADRAEARFVPDPSGL
jgi:hypothetical protein